MQWIGMAVFKPENVEDLYEIEEVLGRYEDASCGFLRDF